MADQLNIYLVRHGQSDDNHKGRWQGTLDGPLSGKGTEQAERLGAWFSRKAVNKVYSSRMKRAYQTAQAIAQSAGTSVATLDDFHEASIELWDGLTDDEIDQRYRNELRAWRADPLFSIDGVEPMAAVQLRAISALTSVIDDNSDSCNVVLVGHAVVLRSIVCWVLGLPLANERQFHLSNASISLINIERLRFSSREPRGISLKYLNYIAE